MQVENFKQRRGLSASLFASSKLRLVAAASLFGLLWLAAFRVHKRLPYSKVSPLQQQSKPRSCLSSVFFLRHLLLALEFSPASSFPHASRFSSQALRYEPQEPCAFVAVRSFWSSFCAKGFSTA